MHRDLGNMIRALMRDTGQKWDQILPQAVFALNTTVSSVTGYSPFQLMFGRDPTTPLHLLYAIEEGKQMPNTNTSEYVQAIKDRFSNAYSFVRDNLTAAVQRRRRQSTGQRQRVSDRKSVGEGKGGGGARVHGGGGGS